MNKVYLLMLCLLSASFTGCIGGEDLEELPVEEEDVENEETEEETLVPVGEDNLTSLEKRISYLEAKIAGYEKPKVYFQEFRGDDINTFDDATNLADDGNLFCWYYEYRDENRCTLVGIAYDVNGIITTVSWESSRSGIIEDSNGAYANNDYSMHYMFGNTPSLNVCDTDIIEPVDQIITLTVYDNDGNSASASYDLDYDNNCVPPESAPEVNFFVEHSSSGVWHIDVIQASRYADLEDFSFFLKDYSGSTYVGGNGFGEVAMQMISGEAHGIDTSYTGDNEILIERKDAVKDDDGSEYPVHFSDNDRDGKLSPGDQFMVYGTGNSANGPAEDGWRLDLQYDPTGDVIETAYLDDFDNSNTIKIGFMNPITGPLEPDAYGFWWGADQAIRDLKEIYPNHNFELIEVDSGCDGNVAALAAYDLIDEGVVAVVGAACSGASMASNAVLSDYGIPMISYASTNPGLSDAEEYPLFYRVVPSDAIQGPVGADMMAYDGVDTGELAILHMTNGYGEGLANSVKDAWEDDGNQLCGAGMQGYEDTTTDFSALAESISGDDTCTAVYLSSYIQDAAGIIEALKDDGWDGKIFAGDGPAGVGLYEKMGDNAEATGVTVSAPRAGFSYGDFGERYDDNAADVGSIKTYVLTAYDTTMIIGHAIANQGNHNLTDSIETVGTDYEGASGLINFLDNGDAHGAGYDICIYSGDTSDANGGYSCTHFWTVEYGVQEY